MQLYEISYQSYCPCFSWLIDSLYSRSRRGKWSWISSLTGAEGQANPRTHKLCISQQHCRVVRDASPKYWLVFTIFFPNFLWSTWDDRTWMQQWILLGSGVRGQCVWFDGLWSSAGCGKRRKSNPGSRIHRRSVASALSEAEGDSSERCSCFLSKVLLLCQGAMRHVVWRRC